MPSSSLQRGATHPQYQHRQRCVIALLRRAFPDALSAREARTFLHKSVTGFYLLLRRYRIRPLAKTAYLTLYARGDLVYTLAHPPPPPDELAARRLVKRARDCARQAVQDGGSYGHAA